MVDAGFNLSGDEGGVVDWDAGPDERVLDVGWDCGGFGRR